ncbi:MAG: SUMF1/EgtB/PvdO family nonheme iron enzyme [Candidatus Latescibacteria bacterium]|nr:SUMF1/EgtB/PvdO family nonheme iron enzyme [Candidatus Latescibacterota bacterium]
MPVFALLFLLAALPSAGQERPQIALVPVKSGQGVPAALPAYVQALLEAELSRSGRFKLVERSRVQQVLEEVNFQQAGVTAADKASELGSHLNAEKLFFTEVLRVGTQYQLAVKVVDVATNEVLKVETETLGPRQEQIQAATRRLARRLIGASAALSPVPMVSLLAGQFQMGSSQPGESPPHVVSLRAFEIDRDEVNQAAYQAFAAARQGPPPPGDHPEQPVTMVSWTDASAYCEWQGKRLPTEAEWEYAARGPESRTYPWGDTAPTAAQARFGGQYKGPVEGSALSAGATPEGIRHLAGNVAEWVQDWWDPAYYASSPAEDPQGPPEGDYRVVRGGSWSSPADELRGSARAYFNPDKGAGYLGFRCARSLAPEP